MAWTLFARSNTGFVGSNPIQCMDFCVDSCLATGWSPVQGVLQTVFGFRSWGETKRFTCSRRVLGILNNNNNNNNKAPVHVGIFWNILIHIILRKDILGAPVVPSADLVTPSVRCHGNDVPNRWTAKRELNFCLEMLLHATIISSYLYIVASLVLLQWSCVWLCQKGAVPQL